MKKIIPILAYVASVLISSEYCAKYWVVGPVFACAFLISHPEKLKRDSWLKSLIFILGSTLIYAFVFWVADHGNSLWRFQNESLDALFGTASAGVLAGSFLQPLFHRLLFPVNRKTLFTAWLALICSWYLPVIVSLIHAALQIPGQVNYMFIAIALWQGSYLKFLKGSL